jgi:hypothetical protein
MGRHPVAVIISRIAYVRTMKVDYSRFSWGGLHEKHVVATDTLFQTIKNNLLPLTASDCKGS